MPGEGVEPPCPRGAPGFKPGASDQFRHPGGGPERSYDEPGSIASGGIRSGPLNWYVSRNFVNAVSSKRVHFATCVHATTAILLPSAGSGAATMPRASFCHHSRIFATSDFGTLLPHCTTTAPCSRLCTSWYLLTGAV